MASLLSVPAWCALAQLPAAVTNQPILFVVRNQYQTDHHNTHTMFPSAANELNTGYYEGGNSALKIFDPATGGVTTLLSAGADGVVRDPDVHFSGTKVLFAWRKALSGSYDIYEINTDGSGLRQLTARPDVDDIDPLYLPDGSIVFVSGREPKYVMCNRHLSHNLYRMDGDGANINQIAKSTLFEGHPSLMEDGRILYDRWEYVDRNFGDAQGLWSCDPEGTGHIIYYGNNTSSPGGIIDARQIPGTQQVVCTFVACHDKPWGAIAVIDRRRAIDGRDAVVHRWPAFPDSWMRVNNHVNSDFDIFAGTSPKYEDPYPLVDPETGVGGRWFLASKNIGPGEHMALCLLDASDGSSVVIHDEGAGDVGCFDPMPVAPLRRPERVTVPRKYDRSTGRFYVADVYDGTHMEGVARGTVKYLRVVESPEKRFWSSQGWAGQGTEAPGVNWDSFETKRILGTVPVEADGSAYFETPPRAFVFFQLLDAEGMMIQSMRSGTVVQPGETQGCLGCHDNRHYAPKELASAMPLAFQRAPSALDGWMGEPPKLFNYLSEVQPVFNARCMECHDYGGPGTVKVTLAGDKGVCFNASYAELWRKGYTGAIGAGPAAIQQAKAWGSHASRLVQALRGSHTSRVTLSAEEFVRIVTWLDLNAVYYPDYASNYPNGAGGRSPLSFAQLSAIAGYTGASVHNAGSVKSVGELISFDRPAMSPCLTGVTGENYANALAIIQTGQAALAAVPRQEMPGFYLNTAIDIWRESKYQRSLRREELNCAAITAGEKVYDGQPLLGVANGDPAALSETSAQIAGTLFYTAGNTTATVYIAWGMWDGGDSTSAWQHVAHLGPRLPGDAIDLLLDELSAGRPVHYRVFAVNEEGLVPARETAVFDTLGLLGLANPPRSFVWSAATAGPVADGAGVWTFNAANWVDAGGAHHFWSNLTGDTAVFGAGGAAGTVAVDKGGMTVGGVLFSAVASNRYQISGGPLTLTNDPVIRADADAVIASALTGESGFVKSGGAALTLSGENSYEGVTRISEGVLRLSPALDRSDPSELSDELLARAVLRLDASAPASLAQHADGSGAVADGDPVGRWGDLSAGDKPATQTNGDRRPTYVACAAEFNGLPVLEFDGVDDDITSLLDINPANLPEMTLFVVYRQVTLKNNGGLWGHDNGGWDRLQLLNFQNIAGNDRIAGDNTSLLVNGLHTNAVLVYTAALNNGVAGGSYVYVNGVADGATGLPAFTSTDRGGLGSITFANIAPGHSYRGHVRIGEVLVFNTILGEAERQAAENSLRHKWLALEPEAPAPVAILPQSAALSIAAGAALDLGGMTQQLYSVSGGGAVSNGVLKVSGWIAPGGEEATGTLTIPGSPRLEGAALRVAIAAGSSDRLRCSGDLALDGVALHLINPEFLAGRSGRYRIILCDGALEGALNEPELPEGWSVVYDRVAGSGSVSLLKISETTIFLLR